MYRAIIVVLFLAGCLDEARELPDPRPLYPPKLCTFTFSWTNPTHDVDEEPLDVAELKAATLYQFTIPMQGWESVDAVYDAGDPYTLMYTVEGFVPARTYWFSMTVSNHDADGNLQESDHSNEIEHTC